MPRLSLHVLASSSAGNCSVVTDSFTGSSIVIDVGICKRDFLNGLSSCGVDPESIAAVLVTHDHSDHVKGLGVCLRGLERLGVRPPVFVESPVRSGCKAVRELEGAHQLETLERTATLDIGSMRVMPFPTSHDALSSCGFRIEAGSEALGFMTDTGYATPKSLEALEGCRLLALEANHDVQMLANGPYPYPLKERVGSTVGHLSNDQAASVLASIAWSGLAHVVGMHLSEENNTPSLALAALSNALARTASAADVACAKPRSVVNVS